MEGDGAGETEEKDEGGGADAEGELGDGVGDNQDGGYQELG